MNKRNEYKTLLKQANEELSKYGVKLELNMDESCCYYDLSIYGFKKEGEAECYATSYAEDELDTLVTEAWHDALKRARRREEYRRKKEEKEKGYHPLEMINRVELLGTVGSAKTSVISDKKITKFSLVTNRCYRDREGCPVIETQWHNCVAIESDKVSGLEKIQKGATVHIFGRIRTQRYTTNTGEEKAVCEIFANKLEVLETKEPIQFAIDSND